MMYFGEDLDKAIRRENEIQQLRVLGVPRVLVDIVINWSDEYKGGFIEALKSGEPYKYAFVATISSIQSEQLKDNEIKIKQLNQQVNGLLELNEQLMDSHSKEFDELEELKKHNKTLDAYSIQLLCEIKHYQTLLDNTLFRHKVERDKLNIEIEQLQSDNLVLDKIIDMKDNRILELKQEVNDCHWLGKKPYSL